MNLDWERPRIYANALISKDEQWFVKEDLNNSGYRYWNNTRRAGISLPPSREDARRFAVPILSQAAQIGLQQIRTVHNQ